MPEMGCTPGAKAIAEPGRDPPWQPTLGQVPASRLRHRASIDLIFAKGASAVRLMSRSQVVGCSEASRGAQRGPRWRGVAYLCFGSPARLLRHIPRQKKPIIPMPIMATPSFMPNQTESNESTVHQPFSRCQQRVEHRFVGTPSPVQQHNHECLFWKKRWYLALSVNAFSTALAGAL